ncbi:hypothetical protein V5O48_010588 [Marasmius crinis-equi]|uniref:Uncharacterized protein n=1 Tax=Marasmius crinis-equi TaxID=585013 RepID=A0ABR3F885_9AGAR
MMKSHTFSVVYSLLALFGGARAAPQNPQPSKRAIYANLQNTTCVLSPDVPRANFAEGARRTKARILLWLALGLELNDLSSLSGVPLTLDVGILDTTTCQPLPNVMVEVWGANPLGDFGDTFLRGSFQTNTAGIAEFQTIFPGFTSDAANHISIAVHQSDSIDSPTAHTGRVFFTDRWTDVISMSDAYKGNTHTRVLNGQDTSFADASKNGFNAIVDIESIGDDWPSGVVGYITLGINPGQSIEA